MRPTGFSGTARGAAGWIVTGTVCPVRTSVVADAGGGNDFPIFARYPRRMNLNAPLPVWLAACAVAFALLSIPVDDAEAVPGIAGTASVIDGDTLEIHGQRIRLHAIDAPESRQTCTRGGETWRCGQASALALSDKIGRRPVRCEQVDIDRYQRIVAKCFADGEDLNGWLVGQGLAVAYRQYGRDYVSVESEAKAARRGMWAGEFVMPWDWRRGAR